nr:hypothetical protein [Amycolatopsis marina]
MPVQPAVMAKPRCHERRGDRQAEEDDASRVAVDLRGQRDGLAEVGGKRRHQHRTDNRQPQRPQE